MNLPESSHMAIVKEAVCNISSFFIPSNWWTGFKSWEDFFGLLQSGTNLPIHTVVSMNRRLERIESGYYLINHLSENVDISIDLHENIPTLMKGYQITAKGKQLWILKQIAAYNVAQWISSKNVISIQEQINLVQQNLHIK